MRHNEEVNGKLFKYDLPVENEAIEFKNALKVIDDDEAPTGLERLYEKLDLDKESSFESMTVKLSQEYSNEVDMYGNIQKAGEVQLKVLEFGIPIPQDFLQDDTEMDRLRSTFRLNYDIPGAIELVHPNKFIANLRPVEEFRHTPVIPISEKDIADYQRKVRDRNRKGYFVEIKKDSIYYYTIALSALGVIAYVFFMANEKSMRVQYEIDRTKTIKKKGSHGKEGGSVL